jgi:predicted  nucleic acid-binding Zn-ribbon protein
MTNGEYQQLVEFLTRQFTAIDERFVAIGQRFVAIDQRFVAIDRRFDGLERRVDEGFREMLGHFDAIYKRMERLEQEYHAIVEGLRRIETSLIDDRARRELLEHGLAELKERVALLQARIDDLERRLRA